MPNSLTAKIRGDIVAEFLGTIDFGSLKQTIDVDTKDISLVNGTGLNQADMLWMDRRTLTASSNEELDLAGALIDAFGATLTFARIKAILIKADATNTNDVHVGGAAANAFVNWVANSSDIIVVKPGGVFLLGTGHATAYAVTAGTGDKLKITNSAGGSSVIYDIIIIGASA